MKVVFYGSLIHHLPPTLLAKVKTPWTTERFLEKDARGGLARALADADVLISLVWNSSFPAAPKLKLIQSPGTGVDLIDFVAVPPGVRVCNCYGHAEGTAEYVMLALLLWCQTSFVPSDASFRNERGWRYSGRVNGPIMGELYGRTVGIVGLGAIGRAVAERLRGFGVRVLGCNRTLREVPHVDAQYPLGRIDEFLAQCDYVVIAAALAPETERLLDAKRFAAMKPSAVLVNVSRGQIADEDALWAALKEKRIRGATLDVWYAYPRHDDLNVAPSKHPFHELDNVWMTPHIAAWTTGMVERRWSEIARNLDSLARGEPLLHQLR
ncbi:MAG: 2-hydroxyacid dehydrogenase [Betaproteobacteria bacterium]|nr:2-hydroxyacid dehydrogenase [Betaproteobacteria bacterium]MDH5219612.1 2-hydroxyacid dehydrogenase [Betaproteobacteria bacterium]MDH5350000.1 2-hydroxyacid dehydrogenase [Betaproteobacteria bacterium]